MSHTPQPKQISASSSERIRAGRRERHKAEIRDRLLRAAIKLFATRGFAATTVEEITEAADVAKGTFFNYFATKELLLADLIERRLEILRQAREEVTRGNATLRDPLRRLMRQLIAEPGRSRSMARCVLLAALNGGPVERVVQQIIIQGEEILREIMATGQQRGEISSLWRPDDLARLFQQLFYGFLYHYGLHPNLNLSHCLDTTLDVFWAGIEAPPVRRFKKSAKRPT